MEKEEYIARHGEVAYAKILMQSNEWYKQHLKESSERHKRWYKENCERVIANREKWHTENIARDKETSRKWRAGNLEKVLLNDRAKNRKGGLHYGKKLVYLRTGLQGARNRIRTKHRKRWGEYKKIIAPDSQLHHQWQQGTVKYDGLALVEADQHMHGIIDVIQILDGEITLFRERVIKSREGK